MLLNLTTNPDGSYSLAWTPTLNDTYQIQAVYIGNVDYNSASSGILPLVVGLQVSPSVSEIGLLGAIIGFAAGLGVSFLVRFRSSVAAKRKQRYGGIKSKTEKQQKEST